VSLLLHRNTKDETGKVFGRLTVLARAESIKHQNGSAAAWLCKCSCGNQTIKRGNLLRRGTSRSCGCLASEVHRETGRKHQHFATNKIRKYPKPSKNWLGGLKFRYNLSPKQWTELIIKANGRCEICTTPFKNEGQSLNVDHSHKTNRIRGLLCGRCNGMLAGLEDKEFCLKATLYLQERDGD